MSRKTMEREARQKFILEAARELFDKKGVENTSMDDIALAVDYTRRTLYTYFKSRDDICLRVFIDDLRKRWDIQKQAVTQSESGLDKIITWGDSFYRFAIDNPHSMRLHYYWDYKGIDRQWIGDDVFSEFESINDELAEGLREIFQTGVNDGSLRPDLQIDLCISQFLYSLRAVLNRALSPTYSFASFDPDEYVKHYLDLFSRGIRNEGDKHE